ncbi:hypothetical protein L6452_01495 [Arctium lappa]|uniref:Uncharacterized protein n=1 Tax=Arctium lappa TaxID=4217 RepID=A0ACB9FHR6_ARCLA|nr:hypothetical protein L6452_01495 [Arctium lappa]
MLPNWFGRGWNKINYAKYCTSILGKKSKQSRWKHTSKSSAVGNIRQNRVLKSSEKTFHDPGHRRTRESIEAIE